MRRANWSLGCSVPAANGYKGAHATKHGEMRGRFITFEGGEGAGKSTQAELLARRLRSHAIAVVVTREPGGSAGADIMRHVLLSGAAKPLRALGQTPLFSAGRRDPVRPAS